MGNATSIPISNQIQSGIDEFLECINNINFEPKPQMMISSLDNNANRLLSARRLPSLQTLHYGALVGIGILTACCLLLSALLAGLTLALCGLDDTLLQLRTTTGTVKDRRMAATVAKMKQHGTWLLCSLILCSCLCGESFPFLVQSLCRNMKLWVAILISTLCLAIIAEIIPQYIIPRNAIAWSYYCCPLIWGCMIITFPISWPLAWLLDISFKKLRHDKTGTFSKEQLEELIRDHSDKKNGDIGPDAARVAIGALKLDARTIGAGMMRSIAPIPEAGERDVEKADEVIVSHGLIVKWSAVKTIKIDDFVDQAFLRRVKGWSYSRIPVISKAEIGPWVGDEKNLQGGMEDWDGTRIYGFLHTRNLVGIELKPGLRVKDLPLYPLPVVRESMSIYELLNMFQLGMSRMAIVVANPKSDPLQKTEITPSVFHDPAEFDTMRWTATKRTNENIVSKVKNNEKVAPKSATEGGKQQNIYGMRTPKPIGIITFEDIIDTILQKTSHDEKDSLTRPTPTPPPKVQKAVNSTINTTPRDLSPVGNLPPISIPKSRVSNSSKKSTLRFRTTSKPRDEVSNLDGANEAREVVRGQRRDNRSDSSYTDNSNGGFHGPTSSVESNPSVTLTAADLLNLIPSNPYGSPYPSDSQGKSSCLNSRNPHATRGPSSKNFQHMWRNISASPIVPILPDASSTPASIRQYMINFDGANDMDDDTMELMMPEPATDGEVTELVKAKADNDTPEIPESHFRQTKKTKKQNSTDVSGETILSLSSWCDSYYERENTINSETIYDALPLSLQRMHDQNFPISCENARNLETISEERSNKSCDLTEDRYKPYEGFPAELLDREESGRVPNYLSFTLPRLPDIHRDFTPVREQSFEDDRALLPSQRKALQAGPELEITPRCSSLWF